jgi:hypothetical protein
MEELFTLKDLLLKGDIPAALALVEELEEMSRDDKISTVSSYAKILLLHLIKQQAEHRTTRSWEVSIHNAAAAIQSKNKRRKAGGYYLTPAELRTALEEAYPQALNTASLEVAEGRYEPDELEQRLNRVELFDRAFALIVPPDTHDSTL